MVILVSGSGFNIWEIISLLSSDKNSGNSGSQFNIFWNNKLLFSPSNGK